MRSFTLHSKSSKLIYPLEVVYAIGAFCCLCLVVLIVLRRRQLAIHSRSFSLVLLSSLGNLGGMTCIALDGMTGDLGTKREWMIFALTLFFEYIFFGPYLLRMFHLKISYFDFMKDESLYWRQSNRLKVRWYAKVLVIGFIPYAVLPALLGALFAKHAGFDSGRETFGTM